MSKKHSDCATATLTAPAKKSGKSSTSSVCLKEPSSSCSLALCSNSLSSSGKTCSSSSHSVSSPKKSMSNKFEIILKTDIGWGNTLFIRGEGANLSWDQGQAMEHNGSEWVWSTNCSKSSNLLFKVLINDQVWSTGENMSASAGIPTVVEPSFQ